MFFSFFTFFFLSFVVSAFFMVCLFSLSLCVFMTGYLDKNRTPTVCRFIPHPDCPSLADMAGAWSWDQPNRKQRETQFISESTNYLAHGWLSDFGKFMIVFECLQFSSVQSLSCVQLFVTPWIAAHQAFLSITNSRSSLRLMSIESVMPSSHLILSRPLLLLPSIFPYIRVFSNESALHIRWPKYWSFS